MPGQQQELQGAHSGLSPHGLFSLTACSHSGEALCYVAVSSFLSLSSTLCPVLSFFLEPSRWQSHRLCRVLTPQQALPVLSHCFDLHLGKFLPGYPLARQFAPRWVCKQDLLGTADTSWGGQYAAQCEGVGGRFWSHNTLLGVFGVTGQALYLGHDVLCGQGMAARLVSSECCQHFYEVLVSLRL